jgi:glycosyltransferase involved in cell wall biosynthesis
VNNGVDAGMLNVTQVNKFYYPHIGGVEKVAFDLATGLSGRVGMNVLVCNHGHALSRSMENGVNIIRTPSLGTFFSMPVSLSFPYWLGKTKQDILHFHEPFPLGDFSYFIRKPKGKVIVTWHSDIIRQKHFLRIVEPSIMNLLNHAERIVATSPNMIENSRILRAFKDKCVVIPLGVDEKRFISDDPVKKAVEKIRSKFGNKIVLFIGRLVYYKGLSFLIDAMRNIEAKLLIIGDGYLKSELVKQCAGFGMEDKVVFLDPVPDEELSSFYHACDVFVLPSVESSEAFGLVQVEAMMCGKPVVSTSLPTGVPYVNKNNETGLVVEPRNSKQLCAAINALLEDDKMRAKMGETAQKRARTEFTVGRMVQSYYDLYQSVTNDQCEST